MLEWLVCAAFLLMGSTIFLGWGLLEICPKERAGLKHFAESILLWGKLSNGKRASKFNVPKRWFAHFYVTGLLVSSTALGMTVFGRQTLTRALFSLPPFGPGSGSCSAAVEPWRIQLALALLTIQTSRRLYECVFVSVFSAQRMEWFDYVVGHCHYIGATLSTVLWGSFACPQPGAVDSSSSSIDSGAGVDVGVVAVAVAVFAAAGCHQHLIMREMASMRAKGASKQAHYIPTGSISFNYVSCPHFTAEILIYASIYVILGPRHLGWLAVLYWVIANQVFTACMTHAWYKKKFPEYPKQRKAIFPFVL